MADGFYVRHNVTAMFAHRQATLNNGTLTHALERLSSGYRINRASDDAAGLAVSEKMRTQVRGYQQALRNIQDGISLIQVSEAGLQEMHDILQRMRELAVQSANGIYSDSDRALLQFEVDQLLNEVNRMQTSVEFNQLKLLDGTFSSLNPGQTRGRAGIDAVKAGNREFTNKDYDGNTPGLQMPSGSTYRGSLLFHVGANENQTFKINISTLSVHGMGLTSLFSSTGAVVGNFFPKPVNQGVVGTVGTGEVLAKGILKQAFAESAIAAIDSAINLVSRQRALLGSLDNRMQVTFNFAGTVVEQLQSSESRIRDADMAAEIIEFTKSQVLVQAANAMLAQANLLPQNVLSLLG